MSKVIINLMVLIFVILAYIVNIVKLAECDFKEPYKCEILHSIGLFGLAPITVFFSSDEEENSK